MQFQTRAGEDVTAHIMASIPEDLRQSLACVDVFHAAPGGGAAAMAASLGLPFLGRVPLDPTLGKAAESGGSIQALRDAPCLPAFNSIVDGTLLILLCT